jgi:hypothetical protein
MFFIVPARKKLQPPPGICMFMYARAQTNSWQSRSDRGTRVPAVRSTQHCTLCAHIASRRHGDAGREYDSKNCGDLILAVSRRRAACSYSDYLETWAAAQTALQTSATSFLARAGRLRRRLCRLRSWHARASVWNATIFRQRPRMLTHANAWWSL